MRIGHTGTRNAPTSAQKSAVYDELLRTEQGWRGELGDLEFHHGDCVGTDAFAARVAYAFGYRVVAHPPSDPGLRSWTNAHETRVPLPYIQRNHVIVDEIEHLIVTPEGPERLRSGTWATVRYARRLERPMTIVWPDGRVESA